MIFGRDRKPHAMVPRDPAAAARRRSTRGVPSKRPWLPGSGRLGMPLAVVGIGVVLGLVLGVTVAVALALAGFAALLVLVAVLLLRRRGGGRPGRPRGR